VSAIANITIGHFAESLGTKTAKVVFPVREGDFGCLSV